MDHDKKNENIDYGTNEWDALRQELEELDQDFVEFDGVKFKPSHCYRITNNSLQVIFNTNCPDDLKEKIQAILTKYSQDENYPREQEFFFP